MDVTDSRLDAEASYLRAQKMRRNAQHKIADGPSGTRRTDAVRRELVEQKSLNPEMVASIEYEAWRLKAMGYKVYEIADRLGATTTQVTVWLQDVLAQIRRSTKDLVDIDKEIELTRTEELLKHHMPLAMMPHVMIEKIRQGEPVAVEDFTLAQDNTWICIELIKLRCKILGITVPTGEQALMPAMDVFSWLRGQQEYVRQQIVASAPKDVLTLEIDEPIDTPKAEIDQRVAEVLPDAV